jgi:hypothetical protein
MRTLAKLLVLSALATTGCASDLTTPQDCGDKCDFLGEFPAINAEPESVLFIPMSSGYLGLSEQKWQSDDVEFDRAIRELSAMYEAKGATEIVTLPRLQRWEDLGDTAASFNGKTFDRVIIVGHGALDGPITRGEAQRTIDPGVIVEQWVMQPGLMRQYTTTFSEERFGAFISDNRDALLTQYDSVTEALYEQISDADQEAYAQCVTAMATDNQDACSTSGAESCSTFEGQERNENCDEGCFNQCIDDYVNEVAGPTCSPINNEFEEKLDEEAYNAFSASLASLTTDDGLIFLGFCNAATDADSATVVAALSGLRSYTDLIAATTGRHASGPIGKTSGQDIINRVTAMEKNRDQKFLYIAAPPKN